MSKKKLLIHEVFKRIKIGSEKNTKGGLASNLSTYLEEKLNFIISKRTLIRYYEAYIEGDEDIDIELYILNRLSQYLEFDDFEDFSTTIEKEGENASTTTVKIDVDNEEVSSVNGMPNVSVIINNSNSNKNDQHFKMPEFIKQNGLGILEMTFVLFLVTGGVVFSKNKASEPLSLMSGWGSPAIDKPYMYWDKDRYMATDSGSFSSQVEVVPMSPFMFKNLKKITRPDTLNAENAMKKVWYDKSANHVEFFTSFGKHPENGKALKDVTAHILETYAGANAELEE